MPCVPEEEEGAVRAPSVEGSTNWGSPEARRKSLGWEALSCESILGPPCGSISFLRLSSQEDGLSPGTPQVGGSEVP